jgi:hypothetical protein
MKNILILTFVVSAFVLVHCTSKKPDKDAGMKKIEIHTIDTVKVNYSGQTLLLSDFRKNLLVFFDFFDKEILITNLQGTILHQFNNSLLGADNFGNQILGVRFQSDTSISVLSDNGYFIYGLNGKIISTYKHPAHVDKVYITGDFKLNFDPKRNMFISLLTTSTDISSSIPEFYTEIKHITTFKLDSQKYSSVIKYEPESSFLQKEYFNNEWGIHFDTYKDTIALIYGRDPIVYIYGLSGFQKKASFKTFPEHFASEVRFKFGENTRDNHKLRLTSFSNSTYRKIFIRGDTVMTSYNAGIPFDEFKNIENLDDLNSIGYLKQHHYLQIFIKGKKEFSDYELPKEFPFVELLSRGIIILGEQSRWNLKKDGNKRFLIANIDYKPHKAD